MHNRLTLSVLVIILLVSGIIIPSAVSLSLPEKNIDSSRSRSAFSSMCFRKQNLLSQIQTQSLGTHYDVPSLSVGDSWEYLFKFEDDSPILKIKNGKLKDFTVTITDERNGNYIGEMNGKIIAEAKLYGIVPMGSVKGSLSGEVHIRKSDFAFTKFIIHSHGKISGVFVYDADGTITFDPAWDFLDFPITDSEQWYSGSTVTTVVDYTVKSFGVTVKEDHMESTFNLNTLLQCATTDDDVETDAGVFTDTAFITNYSGSPRETKMWYSPTVGNMVKVYEYAETGVGDLTFDIELQSFDHQQNNFPPMTPSNPSPAKEENGVRITPSLSWDGGDPTPDDTVSYDIYFGKDSSPEKIDTISFPAEQNRITYELEETLEEETTYYWKITSYDTQGNTVNGPLWWFTTEKQGGNHPPIPPYNPSPSDGQTNVSKYTDLSWQGGDDDIDDTVTYSIFLDTQSTPSTKIDTISASASQQTLTYTPSSLQNETKYYWKIEASDGNATVEGPTWSFATPGYTEQNNPPNMPHRPSPSNNQQGVSTTATLGWYAGDPDENDQVTYEIYLGKNSGSLDLIGSVTKRGDIQQLHYDPRQLREDTTYLWQIVAEDTHGASVTGPVWRFTTKAEDEIPPSVFIKKPANATIYINDQPRFNDGLISLGFKHPVIVGPITLEVLVADNVNGEINEISILIDDHAVYTSNDRGGYYTWHWDTPTSVAEYHWHTIQVLAWDTMGNRGTAKLRVWKLF